MRSDEHHHQPDRDTPPASLLQRLFWFVFLWLAGVGLIGAVAYLLRFWIT